MKYKPETAASEIKYNIKTVTGVLKQHLVAKYGASGQTWIIVPRDNEDMNIIE